MWRDYFGNEKGEKGTLDPYAICHSIQLTGESRASLTQSIVTYRLEHIHITTRLRSGRLPAGLIQHSSNGWLDLFLRPINDTASLNAASLRLWTALWPETIRPDACTETGEIPIQTEITFKLTLISPVVKEGSFIDKESRAVSRPS